MLISTSFQEQEQTLRVFLKRKIDEEEIGQLKSHLLPFLKKEGVRKVILNCENVPKISPGGWEFLIQWRDEWARREIPVALVLKF